MPPRSSSAPPADGNAEPARAYHHGDLKRALVAGALELVAEKGPQGFTMTEAAKRAGVSVAAPYRHFADKDALLAEVAEQGFVLLGQSLGRIAARNKDPRELVVRLARGYVRWALANPDYYKVMFGDAFGAEKFGDLRPAAQLAFALMLEAIETGQKAGVLRRQDPRSVAGPMWSLMHGIALLYIGNKFRAVGIRENADSMITRSITALMDPPQFAAEP